MATQSTSTSASKSGDSSSGSGRMVAGLVGAWLVIQPWIIGSRFWWSEALNTLIGVAALVIALRSEESRRILVRFPVFWLGLLFCGYVFCQAVNPWGHAIERVPGSVMYDVYTVEHIGWLPSGIFVSYFDPNTWRTFVYWLGPWLLACAWWVAVKRRRTGRRLALAVFINGVVMAVLVIIERFRPPSKILWFYSFPGLDPSSTRFGPFVDHNKAAAFLYLSMGAGFALACRLQARARERGKDDGKGWLALFGCLAILASFFSLGSRAGLAVACVIFLGGFSFLLGAALLAHDRSPGLWLGSLVLMAGVATWGAFEFYHPGNGTIERSNYLSSHPGEDVRTLLHQETRHMMQAHPWLGWGGGAFRYVSPDYFGEDYVFVDTHYDGGLMLRSDWSHSDWLQLPFEFGLIGAGILLTVLLYLFGRILWLARKVGAEALVVFLACAGMLAHATVDFPSYNPSVLLLFCLLLVSTLKTAELQSDRAA